MKKCLLIVDMQEEFMEDKKQKDLDSKVAVQLKILSDFRRNKSPVVYSRFEKYGNIILPLAPLPDEKVIIKPYSDGFEGSSLEQVISDCNLIHIVGCNSWPCISLTIDSGLKRGHNFVLYKNAIMARGSRERDVSPFLFLRYLFNFGVKVRNYR